MDKVSVAMSALLTLALVLFMAPGILALNKGKILRNIALWLAIFLALAILYRTFGTDLPGYKNTIIVPKEKVTEQNDKAQTTPSQTSSTPPTTQSYNPPSE